MLAHNYYGSASPSGENRVCEQEESMLRQAGHEVTTHYVYSDHWISQGWLGVVKGALSIPWNPYAYRDLQAHIQAVRPDILHVHNSFPFLSPSLFYAAKKQGVATVFTLHNYRLVCASAMLLRDGAPCHLCLDKQHTWPALYHGCYRKSRLASLPLVFSIQMHHWLGTWRHKVDRFIALTTFQRHHMERSGIPANKLVVKPHFYPSPPDMTPWEKRHAEVVYIGRLSEEKGCLMLLHAWQIMGSSAPQLRLIGDGPMRTQLAAAVKDLGLASRVTLQGACTFEEGQKWLAYAKLLVLPSLCYEGFPMVIREAYALGVPVAVSKHGAMQSLVEDGHTGCLITVGDPEAWSIKVMQMWRDSKRLEIMGRLARQQFEGAYTQNINYKQLMGIYQQAMVQHGKDQAIR
uniref:Putative GT4 n=1 Tax=Magnetococcus massalia (strain MO-1) TaxID=451514 RepID=A0A1S7LHS5_MAGMO|nr:putative GT4 [Candidatus Magnetococcus massalia]